MTDHKDEESNDEGSEDEGEDEEGMICDGVGNALPLISLKKCAAMQSGGVGDDWLLNQSATTISGGVGNALLLRQSLSLDGKLSFTFHKIQAYSITKGIFYPSFFIMKLFDKTTEYCQCDFVAKYLDNTDFILS